MADEVDPAMEPEEPASLQPKSDRARADPQGEELRPRDDAVLPRGEVSDQAVDRSRMHNFATRAPSFAGATLFTVEIHNVASECVDPWVVRLCMWIGSPAAASMPPDAV
jgi:hypothetical protein